MITVITVQFKASECDPISSKEDVGPGWNQTYCSESVTWLHIGHLT